MVLFFEALRIEFGRDIKITLVTPGFVESEITQGKFIDKTGKVDVNPQMRDVSFTFLPLFKRYLLMSLVKMICFYGIVDLKNVI